MTRDQTASHIETCQLGIAAAERCLEMEELKAHWPGYQRRLEHYQAMLALLQEETIDAPAEQ